MHGTVNAFVSKGNNLHDFAAYDFKNECPWSDVVREKNSLKKFQLYKTHNREGQQRFDCDGSDGSCSLANDIYQKLWGWHYKERFHLPEALTSSFGGQWERMGSDTINSFATTYSVAQKVYQNDFHALAGNKLLNRFAVLTHSIGNFTLVPFKLNPQDNKSFNQSRGFRGGSENRYFVHDYFDLSLKLLKENTSEAVFKSYIDTFFLTDYVDRNYNIIPLFRGHREFLSQEKMSVDNPEKFLPNSVDELNEYLENVLWRIEARGKRIVAELANSGIGEVSQPQFQQNISVKKDTPKWAKRAKRLLILFAVCFVAVVLPLFFWIMSDLFSHISFPEAVKTYGLFIVLGEILRELRSSSFLSSVFLLALFLTIILKVIHIFFIRFANKSLNRCKKCGRLFAIKRTERKFLRKEDISVLVKLEDKERDGTVYRTHEQYIPGTRTVYKDTYQCKYCGNTWSCENNVDVKKI